MAYLDYNGLSRFKDKIFEAIASQYSNPNLLINSNFAINQRGKSNYTGSASVWVYTVDGWRIRGSGSSYNVSTNVVTLSNNAFDQKIELPSYLKGKKVTVSMNVSNVSGSLTLRTHDGITENSATLSNGTVTKTITVASNATKFRVYVFGTGSFTPNWAKVEVGEIATLYSPPIISEEIEKCKRYFYILNNNQSQGYFQMGIIFGDGTNARMLLYNAFRIAPTASMSGNLHVYANGYKTVTGVGVQSYGKEYITVWLGLASALDNGVIGYLQANDSASATIEFDASDYDD